MKTSTNKTFIGMAIGVGLVIASNVITDVKARKRYEKELEREFGKGNIVDGKCKEI